MRFCKVIVLCAAMALLGFRPAISDELISGAIDFDRDVRPILSDTCFHCHGPDGSQREADLRLDTRTGAFADLGGRRAIVPGDAGKSELIRRITSADPDQRMPPADSGRKLAPGQIETLRRWIEQGAKWQEHWSFVAPRRPPLPAVKQRDWPRNPIDSFILARLERERLAPSSPAEKETLIRRVTLDLTGLPPTPAEVDAFLADTSPVAYERVVNRLLQSPRYGERMATQWLDAARFADTSGYQSDGPRYMWRWRDWVIEALNANMPFDRFTVEQLAGDLLQSPTLEQRLATGFNRNHRGNAEGGVIPEEYAIEYVVDRVDTTATIWLGLTMACARCHDHKYDPLAQRDFYRMFAYFNNVPENGRALKEGNSPPYIQAPTPSQREQLAQLDLRLKAARQDFARRQQALRDAQESWEASLAPNQSIAWSPRGGLVAHFALDGETADLRGGALDGETADLRGGATDGEFRDGAAVFEDGKIKGAASFDGQRFLDAGDVGDFGYFDSFSIAAWVRPRGKQGGTIVSRMTDEAEADGYYLRLVDGHLQVNLVKRWLDDSIRVETRSTLAADTWQHVTVAYDGSRVASGIKVYFDGKPQPLAVRLDAINQSFASKEPLRIGGGGGPDGRFHGAIDDVRIYDRSLSARQAAMVATVDSIDEIARLAPESRSSAQAAKLRTYFLTHAAPPEIRDSLRRLSALRDQRKRLVESFPTSMVMAEMPQPRETHVLLRGSYDKPGEKVTAGVPGCLPPLPADAPNNRLGLARWLVDPANPLTARVTVNRYWQLFFGAGLVTTVEDFGAQGGRPSHPELLDWLASEFIRLDWDVKAMHRLIVTSATYRQSSRVSRQLAQRDPDNRLLARGPRYRLSAQVIRDQALAAAGLLVGQTGGPSVKPYQPGGLWEEVSGSKYVQDHGADLYRRSLYTYFKRTVAPPTMATFDAAGRETCTVRQTRTNTPLQALATMNDITFVEAARVLAQRIVAEGGDSPAQRIAHAFRLVTARRPTAAERSILLDGYQYHLRRYRQDRRAAKLLIEQGEAPVAGELDSAELAAFTTVAGLILNLDEAVTKE